MGVPIPVVVIPVVVVLLYLFLPGVRELPWTPPRIAGAVLAVAGYILATAARLQLGSSFSVMPQARRLVTHGLYSRLRHPIYVFVDLMSIGLILALHLYWLLVAVPFVIGAQVMQSRREANVLRDAFGQEYMEYRKRTWF